MADEILISLAKQSIKTRENKRNTKKNGGVKVTGKILGKISSAEFGTVRDYPFLMGLQLGFKLGDGCGIMDGGMYTINFSKECRWDKNEKEKDVTVKMDDLYKLLKDAKVNYVSELKNKPVEVEIENNTFKGFRILTEVL